MSLERQEVLLTYKPDQDTTRKIIYRSPSSVTFETETYKKEEKERNFVSSLFKGKATSKKSTHCQSIRSCKLSFPNDEIRSQFEKCLESKNAQDALNVIKDLPEFNGSSLASNRDLKSFLTECVLSSSMEIDVRECTENKLELANLMKRDFRI